VYPHEFPRCTAEQENAIYRIVQEALTNVFRHSGARKASVTLGKGIPSQVSKFRPGSVGVGIGGMRQRVAELGGEMRLENTNPGTLVETVFPVKIADGGRQ
jgi:signal transduction histidine kinase